MVDPVFSIRVAPTRGRGRSGGVRQPIIWPHICRKLHVNWKEIGWGRTSLSTPFISANDYIILTSNFSVEMGGGFKQWRIQDFPEGGREPSRGGVNTPNFPENCMKSKEFGRPGGGVRPSRPPRSANVKGIENIS